MSILTAIAALLALTILGWALQSLLLSDDVDLTIAEKLSLSWLLGFTYPGWLVNISLVSFHRVQPWLWAASCLIVVIAIIYHRRAIAARFQTRFRWRRSSPGLPSPLVLLLKFIVLWQVIYVLAFSLSSTLGHDGLHVWAIKAKAIHLDSTSMPGATIEYFTAATWAYTQNHYPLALPAVEAWIFAWIGGVDEQAAKLISPVCLIALLTLLTGRLKRCLPETPALLLVCLFFATSWLTLFFSTLGYADIALAAVIGAAAAFAADGLRRQDESLERIGLVLAACAPLVKREGWVLSVLFIVFLYTARVLVDRWPVVWKSIRRTVTIFVLIIGPTLLLKATIQPEYKDVFDAISWSTFVTNGARIGSLAVLLASIVGDPGLFGLLWYVLGGFLVIGLAFWNRGDIWFLGGLCFVYIAVMTGSFIFSRWPDYLLHANSLDRLALQVTPVGLLFAAHVWAAIREEEPLTEDSGSLRL